MRSRATSILTASLVLGLGATLVAACSPHDSPSTSPESASDVAVPAAGAPAVSSRDREGAPTFVWADRSQTAGRIRGVASDVARAHLVEHAAVLGISKRLARGSTLAGEHALPDGGNVLQFEQKISGIQVFRTRASVIMDRSNALIAIAGNLRGAADAPSKIGRFVLTPEEALARAYGDHFGTKIEASAIAAGAVDASGEWRSYRVSTPLGAPRVVDEARVRKVYVPVGGTLVAGYQAELVARAAGKTENDGWLFAIAGEDGRTLVENSITAHEAFTYRVWAETGATSQHNIPTDGPLVDTTPLSPTATPANSKEGAFTAPILVTVEGFNKNPAGVADPWLAATATETKGNNVDAYTDRNNKPVKGDPNGLNDGFDGADLRADTTAPRTFDRVYDVTKDPGASANQEKAAVTQIFYVTNWMHDYWYDSGFDEKSGNAQQSNYGRGGKEGDVLHAEAQDGADEGQSNNANMSTLSDGQSPRMQMYVWDGAALTTLTTSPAVAFADGVSASALGAQTFKNVSGAAVNATPANGCVDPITGVSGKIAVIDRGVCSFAEKGKAAMTAGAKAVIVVNSVPGNFGGVFGQPDPAVTIPVVGISPADAVNLRAKIAAGTTTVILNRSQSITRDGTIDNGVVAHEWGHYLHHRLVGCGSKSCGGMSEGWADFNALMMVIKPTDTFDGTSFPLTQYAGVALSSSSSYFGIRRAPYSTDLTKDPFTFTHIRDASTAPTTAPLGFSGQPSEVHNVGEIWAAMLFEGYTNLLRDAQGAGARLTFEQAKRRMADYIVAGMKATPPEPTFVEQRDAVLAVAFARDAKDFAALAKGFAKRGLGVGAVAPPVESKDLNEAVEDSSFKGSLAFVSSTIDDAVRSCDRDGFLDADEKGDLTVTVKNAGWVNLANSAVTVTTAAPGVTFENGGKATILSVDPFGLAKVRVGVALDAAALKQEFVPITINIANADSFKASVEGKIEPRVNFDVAAATTTVDDVESPKPVWTSEHGIADTTILAWNRVAKVDATGAPVSPPDYEWKGTNLGVRSDERLVSPSLSVSATEPLTISFKHKYSFETGPATKDGPDVYFDGAVIEVSQDDGATWVDMSTFVPPGYTQTINTSSTGTPPGNVADDNPLAGRRAFAGVLATYTTVNLDLGTKLAGKTIKIRFRIGTDPASGKPGWEVDDVAFTGLTNKPFATLIDDASDCKGIPIPDAGLPQIVKPGAAVLLDASKSSDPAGAALTFQWEQLDGVNVKLSDPTAAAKTGFNAPEVTALTTLTFRVTVADAHAAASATVAITVDPNANGGTSQGPPVETPTADPPVADHSCGCSTVGSTHNAGLGSLGVLFAGALALLIRGRRRRV